MFIGHFGVGFAGKKVSKKPSLGTMFMAAQFLDLLWPLFLLLGIEHVEIVPGNTAMNPLKFTYYPFSHSLLAALFWSVLFGGIYYLIKKNSKASILLGFLVLSHWILDLIVHIPDLPLSPWGSVKVGLGLWNSVLFTFIIEVGIFLFGGYLYLLSTKPKNKKGTFTFWGLIIFLLLIYVGNSFGSPPPSVSALAYVGLSQWLIVAWGYWIDRNRIAISEN